MLVNIEAERGRLQMTKIALAQTLGISQKTYMAYVREISPIPSNVLLRMSNLFQCSVDYLLGIEVKQAG